MIPGLNISMKQQVQKQTLMHPGQFCVKYGEHLKSVQKRWEDELIKKISDDQIHNSYLDEFPMNQMF